MLGDPWAYYAEHDRHGCMDAMIHGGGFILVNGPGTETLVQGYNIEGVPLFSQFDQPMVQDTLMLDDGEGECEGCEENEANTGAGVENASDGKKKGMSQRTPG
jgi:hypothetical protein